MDWIISLIIGGIVGWLASFVMKSNAQTGWIAILPVGVVGSTHGFWIAGLLGITASGGVLGSGVALAGAALPIFIVGLLGVFGKGRAADAVEFGG